MNRSSPERSGARDEESAGPVEEPGGAGTADRASEAYGKLRDLIVGGRLAPGSRIIEREFAARLAISRTPVRAALQRLQQEGYVAVADGGRLVVAPLTDEDARELFHLVAVLEGLAVEAASRLPDGSRLELAEGLRRTNRALEEASRARRTDPTRWFDLDSEFHGRYVQAAGGPRTRSFLHAIKPQAERYARIYVFTLASEIGVSLDEHERIIDAIEQGNPEAAEQAVRANWRNAAQRLSQVIGTLGERGTW